MTAPDCKDCAYVRDLGKCFTTLFCGVKRRARPRIADQRAPDGPCGPDGKLFAERERV